jgi:hypothetical protein
MNRPGSFDPIVIHIHIRLTGFSFPRIKINDEHKITLRILTDKKLLIIYRAVKCSQPNVDGTPRREMITVQTLVADREI